MELIDRDEAIKALTPPESGKYKHVRQIIRGLPAVDAIPIDWIRRRYPLSNPFNTIGDYRQARYILEVIRRWEYEQKEQEEQNEID